MVSFKEEVEVDAEVLGNDCFVFREDVLLGVLTVLGHQAF